ncbi:hypothetical protein WG66_016262 [Moniliophthora roreri]|nr:hypothetical protein WG66_016262 [Moniliophthora roreri]
MPQSNFGHAFSMPSLIIQRMPRRKFVNALVCLHTSNSHDVIASFLRTTGRVICSANDPEGRDDFAMSCDQMTWFILCIHDQNPLFPSLLHRGGTHAFTKLLSVIIIVPKALHQSITIQKLEQLAFFMSQLIVTSLHRMMPGPTWITEAFDAGLFKVIFQGLKAHRRHRILSTFPRLFRPVFDALATLVDHVNMFLAYPSVLRRVLGSFEHLHIGERDEKLLRKMGTTFLRSWERIEYRVVAIGEIYRNFKESEGGYLCGYDECPKKLEPSQKVKPKYVRCSGCSSIVYCSRECAKRCWRTSHRENCARLERDLKNARPVQTNVDIRFFRAIIRAYLVKHRSDIETQFSAHGQERFPHTRQMAVIDWRQMDMTSSSSPLSWKDVEEDMECNNEENIRMLNGEHVATLSEMFNVVDEDQIILAFIFPVSTMEGGIDCVLADSLDAFEQPL